MSHYPLMEVWCSTCKARWLVPSTTADGDVHVFHDRNLEKHVALNIYDDSFFDEVASSIEEIYGAGSITTGAVGNVHAVLSEVADRDETGGKFDVLANISCPACGADSLAFQPTDPPQRVTEELPLLRHEHWSALTDLDRVAEVKKILGK
jgi:hypothetical protein